MKFLSFSYKFFVLILISLSISCNNEDISKITEIYLYSNTNELLVGNTFSFTVEGNNSIDITEESIIKVNNIQIDNAEFITYEPGTYTVQSFYEDKESQTITVRVLNPSAYIQKVLVEDYTGTWCGYCPRVAYAIEQVKQQSNKVVSVAIHILDDYTFDGAETLKDEFGVTGLPAGKLNRMTDWSAPQQNHLDEALNLTGFDAPLGVAINSELDGVSLNVSVRVGFKDAFTEQLNVVVYLLENGLHQDQTNYTADLYSPGYENPLPNFEHNDVLRDIFTSHLGDVIPSNETIADNIYELDITKNLPATIEDYTKLHLVAFVVDAVTKEVINVQEAMVGEEQNFQ